ncbi:GNAT family N-acetyltransferase [Thermococcus sp. 21S7]|uniref:GNAT family N-acetyltransferase n=1 Tax=Thermococcus sp. 21S7 TaxID=1638221 RepID=UPI001F0D509E|nr:GNAT family N-acetyltransferase [Thermococcus sp. 21S7]
MKMEIIHLTGENLPDFQSLYVEFFRELRGKQGWKPDEEESYRREAETYFKRGDVIFLAYEGEPAGFIRLSSREGCFWVEELFVRPEFRGRGIGRALVERAEEEVRKHDDSLYLFVLPQDKDAIAFWKRLGYDTINTVELVKDLKPSERTTFHTVELLGERFKIFRWRGEKFTEEEKRFMELLKEFYQKGGTGEAFLRAVNAVLEKWLAGVEECREALERVGIETGVTPAELWTYLNARTYENDVYGPADVISSEYLLLHEVREIECLKARGFEITPNVITENPDVAYECHLKALEDELELALERGDREWLEKRLGDLKGHLEDENLPEGLKERVLELTARFEKC